MPRVDAAGKAYAVYLHVKLPRKPKASDYDKEVQADVRLNLPAGRYQAEWVNTKTGKIDKSEVFRHRGGEKRSRVSPVRRRCSAADSP